MYIGFFFSLCVLIAFYKIGEFDDEIGRLLGFATGLLICVASLVYSAGLLRIVLYAICGFFFLTVYKILRGLTGHHKHESGHRD
jgi:hypothetical protein